MNSERGTDCPFRVVFFSSSSGFRDPRSAFVPLSTFHAQGSELRIHPAFPISSSELRVPRLSYLPRSPFRAPSSLRSAFRVPHSEFRSPRSDWFRTQSSELRIQLAFRVPSSVFRVQSVHLGEEYIFAQEALHVAIESLDGLGFSKTVSLSGVQVVLVRYSALPQGGNYHF